MGNLFFEVGTHVASGTSAVKLDYSFIDKTPLIGRTYYRLKEVDIDGYSEYFAIRSVTVSGTRSVSIYPNPLVNKDELTIGVNFSSDDIIHGTITDISGLEVKKFSFSGTKTVLPFSAKKGTYLLSLTNGKESFVKRFIVQ